jgi:hypothetical protein
LHFTKGLDKYLILTASIRHFQQNSRRLTIKLNIHQQHHKSHFKQRSVHKILLPAFLRPDPLRELPTPPIRLKWGTFVHREGRKGGEERRGDERIRG